MRETHLERGQDCGLLDDMAWLAGCQNLSDLRYSFGWESLARILPFMDSEAYSLEEWHEAVQYVLDENKQFAAQEEANAFMLAEIRSILGI